MLGGEKESQESQEGGKEGEEETRDARAGTRHGRGRRLSKLSDQCIYVRVES